MAQKTGVDMTQDYGQVFSQFERDVEAAIEDLYRQEGYVDDGEPSEMVMKEAAFKAAMKTFIVSTKRERSKKALTEGEFYSLVFPSGPGAGKAAPTLDRVDAEVLRKLAGKVWGLTQTKRGGNLQRRLEVEESTLVVCRCKVLRYAEFKQAVYATDNETLIMEDVVDKEIQSLYRRASSLRRDLSMVIERHPKLQGKVAEQLGIELKRIDRELTIGTEGNGSQKRLEVSAKG
ncbi:MAG TPA: hypothetical protein VF009_07680 [Solirubrobacterales bacterium]